MCPRTLYNVKGDAFDKALVVAQVMRGEQFQGTAGEAVGPAMLTVPSTTTRSTRRASPVELESSWTRPGMCMLAHTACSSCEKASERK
jgi:hypothetical protein